ncbi:MAG: metalloregulator ArsR/SmtB family transcription factor [Saprospiraceae bacterium]|nr:metalloregulator ArsR/SmtB family transcription factor [Saprospiraceae bacterium]
MTEIQTTEGQTCIRQHADQVQIHTCRQKLKKSARSFETLSQILSLAGNEVRLKMLFLMEEEGELCPCDLSDILGMSIPAVSQHLRKLKDANIVQIRKSRQTIFYSLKSEPLAIIRPLFSHITEVSGAVLV